MSLGFSIGDVLAVLELANKVRRSWVDAPPEYAAIYNSTRDLSNVLRDITDLGDRVDLTPEQAADLQSAVSSCTAVLESLDAIVNKYSALNIDASLPQKRVRRLWQRLKLDPDDVRNVRAQLTSALVTLNAIHSRLVGEWTYDIKEDVKNIVQGEVSRKNLEIANWLVSAESAEQQSDYLAQQRVGTGTWFLNHPQFQSWYQSESATLVCPGIPGSGKTVLLAATIKHLQDQCETAQDTAVIYFYYNYRRSDEHNIVHILSTFVRQLLQQQDQIPQSLSTFYQKHGVQGERPTAENLRGFFREYASIYRKIYVVIDALDEANTSSSFQPVLLEDIFKLQQEGQNISLLASTRERPDILECFDGKERLEIQAHREDVYRYLDGRMSELMSGVARNAKLQMEIKTRVSDLAGGMFLLARLHFDALCNETTPRAVHRALDGMSQGSQALVLAYESAHERINHQSKGRRDLANQVLMWISCGLTELTVHQLQHALAVEPNMDDIDDDYDLVDEHDLLSVCAGLVVVDAESSVIRLVHFTLQEYMDHARGRWFPDAYTFLATKCVDYLLLDTFARPKQLGEGKEVLSNELIGDEETSMWDRTEDVRHAFRNHAAKYWGVYATRSPDSCIIRELCLSLSAKPIHFRISYQLLLAQLSNTRTDDREGVTLLHVSAYFGFTEFAEDLLNLGHDLGARDSHAMTPLMWAVLYGTESIFDLFLDRSDIDPNLEVDWRGVTLLIMAAGSGHNEIVRSLLQRPDLDPNISSRYDGTAISEAVSNGHFDVVETLLCHPGIDPHTTGSQKWSLIQQAAWQGNIHIFQLLLNHVTWPEHDWSAREANPLHLAARQGHVPILQLLVQIPNVDINLPDLRGCTALAEAARWDQPASLTFLLSQPQTLVNFRDEFGRTPIMKAMEMGYCDPTSLKIVMLLANCRDVDLNCQDENGHSALVYLILRPLGDLDGNVMKVLLSKPGIEVNCRDKFGYTPLHYAMQQIFSSHASLLLQHSGTDSEPVSRDGHTPFSISVESKRIEKALADRQRFSEIIIREEAGLVNIVSSQEAQFTLLFDKRDLVGNFLQVQDVWKALGERWHVNASHVRLKFQDIDLTIGWFELFRLNLKEDESIYAEIDPTPRTFEYTEAEIAEMDSHVWDKSWQALRKVLAEKEGKKIPHREFS